MDDPVQPRILTAETLSDGLVLKFDDGRCAFYSSQLLYSLLSWAEEMDEENLMW